MFHEITKTAIEHAIAHPRKIFIDLVNAQQSRRILDRIVGYEVSPVLWRKVRSGLSAGRVQSVAVKLLVEREREIRAFVPEETWKIEALVSASGIEFSIEFLKEDGKNKKFKNEADALKFFAMHGIDLASVKASKDKKGSIAYYIPHAEDFSLRDIEKKESRRTP